MPIPPGKKPTVRQMLAPAAKADATATRQAISLPARKIVSETMNMASSPYVQDTLAQAVANMVAPSRISARSLPPNRLGQALQPTSEITINTSGDFRPNGGRTPAELRDLRNVMTHEFAHVATNPQQDFPAYMAVARPALSFRGAGGTPLTGDVSTAEVRRTHPNWSSQKQMPYTPVSELTNPELSAIKALDWYYSQSKATPFGERFSDVGNPTGEAFAQAFTNAVAFLAENATDVQPTYRSRLGQLEGNTPGAGQIVQDLLSRDIYARHPLRQMIVPSSQPVRR